MKLAKITTATALLMLATTASAEPPSFAGDTAGGSVIVTSGGRLMVGTMNVRFDPGPGHESSLISATININSISFSGFDAVSNVNFSCLIPEGDPLFERASDIANSLGDGSYLVVIRDLDTNQCTNFAHTKYSHYQQ